MAGFWQRLLRRLRRKERLETSWGDREVLVGSLRTKEQLNVNLGCRFYHMPADAVPDADHIRYVAIYQSRRFFGPMAGVEWYGRVKKYTLLPRNRIREIPREKDTLYCRFDVEKWIPLEKPILPKERGFVHLRTTLFQLHNSREIPELTLESPEQFRLYGRLRSLTEKDWWKPGNSFRWGACRVRLRRGEVIVSRGGQRVSAFSAAEYRLRPGENFLRQWELWGK